MTVRPGSTVRVVNRTGHAARLRVAGEQRGMIPAGGETEVVFRRGATPVLLTPVCAPGPDTGLPVLITAVPSASTADPGADPDDPADVAATMRAKSAGKGSPARTSTGSRGTDKGSRQADTGSRRTDKGSRRTDKGSRRPDPGAHRANSGAHRADPGARRTDAVTTAPRPARTGKKDPRRATSGPGLVTPARSTATTSAAPMRDGVPARLRKTPGPPPISGTGDEALVIPGLPPGGRIVAEPSSTAPYQAGVVPPLTETDYLAALGLEPETVAGSVMPSVTVGRIEDERPVGLLALTAVVCVLGVTTAAIRAIVSQRASRANMS
ncbi:MAG TPA: hypothetical protein VN408_05930 [Actinoplanes sp.]|nr:hypothetical protein [Actinoplanes sp.]